MAANTNLENLIGYGALGDRPTAGIPGRLYYVTDSSDERLTRDNGSTWDDLDYDASYAPGTGGSALPADGWVSLGQTLTYSAADDPSFTAVCSGVDLTSTLSVGMRLRVSQSTGGTKYFLIHAISFSTDTTLTLFGGTDYNLENEAISSPHWSPVKAPFGFPPGDDKWEIKTTDTSSQATSGTTQNTVYNPGSLSMTLKPGKWHTYFEAAARGVRTTGGGVNLYVALSTANNSISDVALQAFAQTNVTGGTGLQLSTTVRRSKTLDIASSTPYYLVMKTDVTSLTAMEIRGDLGTTVLRAVSAYL